MNWNNYNERKPLERVMYLVSVYDTDPNTEEHLIEMAYWDGHVFHREDCELDGSYKTYTDLKRITHWMKMPDMPAEYKKIKIPENGKLITTTVYDLLNRVDIALNSATERAIQDFHNLKNPKGNS